MAYLLLKGKLPNQAEFDAYITRLKGLRGLPQALKAVLEQIPASAHPMDVMRTGASMLGNLETEQRRAAGRLRPPAGGAAIDHLLLVPLLP